jgi:hypothetical protein
MRVQTERAALATAIVTVSCALFQAIPSNAKQAGPPREPFYPVRIPNYPRSAPAIQGRVIDQRGKPIARAIVVARYQIFRGELDPSFLLRPTRSDSTGRFAFPFQDIQKPVNHTSVSAWSEGYAGGTVSIEYPGKPAVIKLERGHTMRIRAVSVDGRPVAGICFSLSAHPTKMLGAPYDDRLNNARPTDSGGRTAIRYLLKGKHSLHLYIRNATWTFYDRGSNVVPVSRALSDPENVVRVAPAASVEGTLTTVTGTPIPNRSLRLYPTSHTLMFRDACTDKLGRFRMSGIPHGVSNIAFSWAEYDTYGYAGGSPYVVPDTTSVYLQVGEQRRGLTLIAPRGSEIKGRVLNAATGRPIESVYVGVFPAGSDCGEQSHTGKSDRNGIFRFRVRPGTWAVDLSSASGDVRNVRWSKSARPPLSTKEGVDVDLGDIRVSFSTM